MIMDWNELARIGSRGCQMLRDLDTYLVLERSFQDWKTNLVCPFTLTSSNTIFAFGRCAGCFKDCFLFHFNWPLLGCFESAILFLSLQSLRLLYRLQNVPQQVCTDLPKVCEARQSSRLRQLDRKTVSYWGPTDITHRRTKCSHPRFVHSCRAVSLIRKCSGSIIATTWAVLGLQMKKAAS
jgi:hypothetical protein